MQEKIRAGQKIEFIKNYSPFKKGNIVKVFRGTKEEGLQDDLFVNLPDNRNCQRNINDSGFMNAIRIRKPNTISKDALKLMKKYSKLILKRDQADDNHSTDDICDTARELSELILKEVS